MLLGEGSLHPKQNPSCFARSTGIAMNRLVCLVFKNLYRMCYCNPRKIDTVISPVERIKPAAELRPGLNLRDGGRGGQRDGGFLIGRKNQYIIR